MAKASSEGDNEMSSRCELVGVAAAAVLLPGTAVARPSRMLRVKALGFLSNSNLSLGPGDSHTARRQVVWKSTIGQSPMPERRDSPPSTSLEVKLSEFDVLSRAVGPVQLAKPVRERY